MKRHLANAGYGVLDYLSYPLGMLLVAPLVLRRMGAAEYGLWMIATSIISAGGIIASGFGDACIQRVAYLRGARQPNAISGAVRSLLGLNLILGIVLGAAVWFSAPLAASRIAASQRTAFAECQLCLRIAAVAIALRAIETVPVAAQRAFEAYRGAVQISTATRLLTLAGAAFLAVSGFHTVSILAATVLLLAFGAAVQFSGLAKLMSGALFLPAFHPGETRLLLRRGFFVWLQALGGVVFGQFDRIILGLALGALAVTPYALCVQFAHPILGLTASGLNFLFPHLSSRSGIASTESLRRTVAKAFACNLALVSCGAGVLLIFGNRLIRIWAGPSVAQSAQGILPSIVIGSALVGLSVSGTYALQALGEFRTVALISLCGRAAMLLLMIEMLRHQGLQGLALSRLFYGSVALLVYIPLVRQLRTVRPGSRIPALALPIEAREASKP
jgi:O-antigen/teichoic acid export membrane protein